MADILVVDDDLEFEECFAEILRDMGHEVRTACNGEDGLSQLGVRLPDVVLLDVDMPGLNGPGMAWRMFIEDLGKEKVPILLVSANPDLPRIAGQMGTRYFLAKPFDLGVLGGLIERTLDEHAQPSWPER
jgi:DNA-binding NtrC family response regulator